MAGVTSTMTAFGGPPPKTQATSTMTAFTGPPIAPSPSKSSISPYASSPPSTCTDLASTIMMKECRSTMTAFGGPIQPTTTDGKSAMTAFGGPIQPTPGDGAKSAMTAFGPKTVAGSPSGVASAMTAFGGPIQPIPTDGAKSTMTAFGGPIQPAPGDGAKSAMTAFGPKSVASSPPGAASAMSAPKEPTSNLIIAEKSVMEAYSGLSGTQPVDASTMTAFGNSPQVPNIPIDQIPCPDGKSQMNASNAAPASAATALASTMTAFSGAPKLIPAFTSSTMTAFNPTQLPVNPNQETKQIMTSATPFIPLNVSPNKSTMTAFGGATPGQSSPAKSTITAFCPPASPQVTVQRPTSPSKGPTSI